MSYDYGIASAAMGMKSAELAYSMNIATLRATMDTVEEVTDIITEQLMNVNVGPVAPSALDTLV